jgi:hypothetical protein
LRWLAAGALHFELRTANVGQPGSAIRERAELRALTNSTRRMFRTKMYCSGVGVESGGLGPYENWFPGWCLERLFGLDQPALEERPRVFGLTGHVTPEQRTIRVIRCPREICIGQRHRAHAGAFELLMNWGLGLH